VEIKQKVEKSGGSVPAIKGRRSREREKMLLDQEERYREKRGGRGARGVPGGGHARCRCGIRLWSGKKRCIEVCHVLEGGHHNLRTGGRRVLWYP